MMAMIDKGFVELLNRRTGLSLTFKEFCGIILERKTERGNGTVIQRRKKAERDVQAVMYDLMD